jgi:tRNA dimethylallyltransferase
MAAFDFQTWIGQARPAALLIAGPTASGKSALALEAARQLDGEIINADSMQIYSDLRILSARPTADEEAIVPHHLYGFLDGATEFSVGAYLRKVEPILADCESREKLAILVGGTGLYFKALTQGLAETPPVPDEIRADVAARSDLHAALTTLDPAMAARLNPADEPRLQRALGVVLATGRSLLDWQRDGMKQPLLPTGSWRGVLLNPDRVLLRGRIHARFDVMMANGALEEASALSARGLPRNRGVMKAHGVPHLIDHLNGLISREEAIERGKADTRRYAKRQRNFFKGQLSGFETLL